MCKSPEWNLERLFAIRFHILCDQQWALESWGPPSSSAISAQLAGQEGLGVLWEVKGHCYRGILGFVVIALSTEPRGPTAQAVERGACPVGPRVSGRWGLLTWAVAPPLLLGSENP